MSGFQNFSERWKRERLERFKKRFINFGTYMLGNLGCKSKLLNLIQMSNYQMHFLKLLPHLCHWILCHEHCNLSNLLLSAHIMHTLVTHQIGDENESEKASWAWVIAIYRRWTFAWRIGLCITFVISQWLWKRHACRRKLGAWDSERLRAFQQIHVLCTMYHKDHRSNGPSQIAEIIIIICRHLGTY